MAENQIVRIKGLSNAQLRKLSQKPTDTVYVKAAAPWTRFGSSTQEVTEKGLAEKQLTRRAAIQKSNAAETAKMEMQHRAKEFQRLTQLKQGLNLTYDKKQQANRTELQTSQTEIAQLKAELKTAREAFSLTDGNMKTALADHKQTIASLNAETKVTLNQNVKTIANLEQTINDYLGQIMTLTKQLSILSHIESTSKKQEQNVLSLETELSKARAQLVVKEAAMEKVISLHAKEIKALRSTDAQSAATLEQQIKLITELNFTKEAQANSILELNSELIALKQPFTDASSLGLGQALKQQQQSTKITALKEKIDTLNGHHEEEIDHMRGTISTLQAQLKRQKSRKEVQVVQHQPAGSNYQDQDNIRQLTLKNVDLKDENNELNQELNALEQELAKYRLEKQGSQRQKTRFTTKASSDADEIKSLNEQFEAERSKNKTCESKLKILNSNATKLKEENTRYKSTLEEYEQVFENQNETIHQLKHQLNQLQTERDEMLSTHVEQKGILQSQLKRQRQQKQQLNNEYRRRQ